MIISDLWAAEVCLPARTLRSVFGLSAFLPPAAFPQVLQLPKNRLRLRQPGGGGQQHEAALSQNHSSSRSAGGAAGGGTTRVEQQQKASSQSIGRQQQPARKRPSTSTLLHTPQHKRTEIVTRSVHIVHNIHTAQNSTCCSTHCSLNVHKAGHTHYTRCYTKKGHNAVTVHIDIHNNLTHNSCDIF